MKKRGICLVLIGILLVLPIVFAEEQVQNEIQKQPQTQTYPGFNRFLDNTRLFFSSGDNKVNLALEIREKEVVSALEKFENSEKESALNNLERARKKLLIVQSKVSIDNANEVKSNINTLITKINENQNISEEIETYLLEEEKTQLTAELVIETDGKEGQTLKREIVKNESTGQNMVRIVVVGENGEEIITEIQGQIGQIQNRIAERFVKIDIAGKANEGDLENGVYVAKGEGNGDNGLKTEVKTYTAEDGTDREEELPEPDLDAINPDLYDPDARAPGDTIGEPGEITYAEGTSAEGSNELAP
jgi:hypothetical protein